MAINTVTCHGGTTTERSNYTDFVNCDLHPHSALSDNHLSIICMIEYNIISPSGQQSRQYSWIDWASLELTVNAGLPYIIHMHDKSSILCKYNK